MVSTARPTRRVTALIAALVAAFALLPAAGNAQESGDPTVSRLAGEDRYATAAKVADRYDPGVERVFLATGETFPDALAAGPVASRLEAPVLLVERDRIPGPTATQLERLDPRAITVLGGTVAVSRDVERQARQYTDGEVERVAGENRYQTAAALAEAHADGTTTAFVVTGEDFPDALTAGPAAVVQQGALVLVGRTRVPAATRQALRRLAPDEIVAVGGPEAIQPRVLDRLADLTHGEVTRIAGEDRYDTAAQVALTQFGGTRDTVYLATGEDFPDALAGGAAAGRGGAPLLTATRRCVPDPVAEQLERLEPQRVVLLGGRRALGPDVAELVACSDLAQPQATTIQTGLAAPWDVVFTPDGRTFVTERDAGRVVERFANGRTETVATFTVDADGEGGLLGLAASPDYVDDRWLYAMFTTSGDQRIVRFRADSDDRQTIVSGLPANTFHNAGRIAFGPDGMLYVGVGDAGVPDAAQDRNSLAGKILRYTPTGGVPADNPFGTPVWAYGLRDPQGLAWDAAGRLFATEFGPDRDDEINRILPGENYGWPAVTGSDGGNPDYRDPIVVRQPSQASWSGATVLVGGDIPDWEGDLFVAALRGQRLYRVDLEEGSVVGVEELLVGQYGRLRHVAQAPDGALWILTSNRDGRGSPVADDDRIVRLGR